MLVGCGRIAFDPSSMTGDGGPQGDGDAAVDGVPKILMTVTFTNGQIADTSISNAGPATDNYGATNYMLVQAASAAVSLVHIDISSIPAGSTIERASLRLRMVGGDPGGVTAYQMMEDWLEGTADGTTGVASYNERTAGIPWTGMGATPPSRKDVPAGSSAFVNTATPCDIPLSTQLVQLWHNSPAQNYGVALIGTSVNTNVATREAGEAAMRPVLTVDYTPP